MTSTIVRPTIPQATMLEHAADNTGVLRGRPDVRRRCQANGWADASGHITDEGLLAIGRDTPARRVSLVESDDEWVDATSRELFMVSGRDVRAPHRPHRIERLAPLLVLSAVDGEPPAGCPVLSIAVGDVLVVDGRQYVVCARQHADPELVPAAVAVQRTEGVDGEGHSYVIERDGYRVRVEQRDHGGRLLFVGGGRHGSTFRAREVYATEVASARLATRRRRTYRPGVNGRRRAEAALAGLVHGVGGWWELCELSRLREGDAILPDVDCHDAVRDNQAATIDWAAAAHDAETVVEHSIYDGRVTVNGMKGWPWQTVLRWVPAGGKGQPR